METVLVVDDEPTIREVVVRYLRRDGFQTLEASDGERARELVETGKPSLVVLDVMLPGTDGLSLCRWIRSRSSLPVILLTARGDEVDRIVGLELGADDYVTKPFSPREVVARVRAVLRRSTTPPTGHHRTVAVGDLQIDGHRREVRRKGAPVRLTRKEFDLLFLLASNVGRAFSRSELLEDVWDFAWDGDTATVTVHVRRLREKIEDDPSHPRHLVTVWGVGYRFDP